MTRVLAEECLILSATEAISAARNDQKVSVEELARRAWMPVEDVREFLGGERDFRLRSIAGLAHALGIELTVERKDAPMGCNPIWKPPVDPFNGQRDESPPWNPMLPFTPTGNEPRRRRLRYRWARLLLRLGMHRRG